MRFTLEMEIGSKGLKSYAEIVVALAQVAGSLDTGASLDLDGPTMIHAKGNTIGKWEVAA